MLEHSSAVCCPALGFCNSKACTIKPFAQTDTAKVEQDTPQKILNLLLRKVMRGKKVYPLLVFSFTHVYRFIIHSFTDLLAFEIKGMNIKDILQSQATEGR